MLPLPVILFARTWWKAGAGFVVGAALAFPLGQCSGQQAQKRHEEVDRAVAVSEALKTNAVAIDKNASQRVADAQAIADLEERLTDAVAEVPDTLPSERRVRRACVELRDDGTDISGLAACRGIGDRAAP